MGQFTRGYRSVDLSGQKTTQTSPVQIFLNVASVLFDRRNIGQQDLQCRSYSDPTWPVYPINFPKISQKKQLNPIKSPTESLNLQIMHIEIDISSTLLSPSLKTTPPSRKRDASPGTCSCGRCPYPMIGESMDINTG